MAKVAVGGLHSCSVSVADILRVVLVGKASAFVLAHNHPSGDPTPSEDDVVLTRAIEEAGKLIGLPLLDHVIIAGAEHSSVLR